MNKIVLLTGVIFGIVVAFTISEPTFFSYNVEDNANLSRSQYYKSGAHIGTWSLDNKETSDLPASGMESHDNENTPYFVTVKDTVKVSKGWRPKEK